MTKRIHKTVKIDGETRGVHRLIAEKAVGRRLPKTCRIHHVNGVENDNRNQNLVICENESYHRLLHRRRYLVNLGCDPDISDFCSSCKEIKPRSEFYDRPGRTHHCKKCQSRSARNYAFLKIVKDLGITVIPYESAGSLA